MIIVATDQVNGLLQKKRNSVYNTMELRLFYIKPSSVLCIIWERWSWRR